MPHSYSTHLSLSLPSSHRVHSCLCLCLVHVSEYVCPGPYPCVSLCLLHFHPSVSISSLSCPLSLCLSPLPSLSLPLCPSSLSLNHLHFSLTLCLCVSVPIHLRVSVSLCLYVCLQPSLCLYASSLTVGFSLFLSSSTYSCPGPDPSLWLHSLWPEPGAVLASAALSRPPVCPSFLLLDRRVSAHTSHICLPADCRERGRWLWTLGRNPFWAAVGPENAPELVNSLTH